MIEKKAMMTASVMVTATVTLTATVMVTATVTVTATMTVTATLTMTASMTMAMTVKNEMDENVTKNAVCSCKLQQREDILSELLKNLKKCILRCKPIRKWLYSFKCFFAGLVQNS
jgi:hypothetical protein